MFLTRLVACKLSPGEEGYQAWEMQGEVWSPNRIPGYVQTQEQQALDSGAGDKDAHLLKIEKTRKSNTNDGHEEEMAIENTVLSHSFDRYNHSFLICFDAVNP